MSSDIIECIFSPVTGRYQGLLIPAWVAKPTLRSREDDVDILTVRVSRRFKDEVWILAPAADNVLITYRMLGAGRQLGNPRSIDFEIIVPRKLFLEGHFLVFSLPAGK
jgi:hypothetical protein